MYGLCFVLTKLEKLFILINCITFASESQYYMKNKQLRITEKDFLLANRRASRAEEIEKYGRQISMRSVTHKSKKVYDRKRLKKAGIKDDDLPLL